MEMCLVPRRALHREHLLPAENHKRGVVLQQGFKIRSYYNGLNIISWLMWILQTMQILQWDLYGWIPTPV